MENNINLLALQDTLAKAYIYISNLLAEELIKLEISTTNACIDKTTYLYNIIDCLEHKIALGETDDVTDNLFYKILTIIGGAYNLSPLSVSTPDEVIITASDNFNIVATITPAVSANNIPIAISTILWEKVSGGSITIVGANTNTLTLSNVLSETYVFKVTVTDVEGNQAISFTTVEGISSYMYYGPSVIQPTTLGDVNNLIRVNYSNNFTLNTGTTNRFFTIVIRNNINITSIIDLDSIIFEDITNQYLFKSNITINSAPYKIYTLELAIPYSTNHRHKVIQST